MSFSDPRVLTSLSPCLSFNYGDMMSARLRINNYHTPKARLVGPKAAHVPPAWKNSNIPAAAQAQVNGHANRAAFGSLPGAGRILLSNLPVDVMLDEVVVSRHGSDHSEEQVLTISRVAWSVFLCFMQTTRIFLACSPTSTSPLNGLVLYLGV